MTMHKDLQMRCPRLGGEVTFAYCEREGGELPCQRIVTCWQLVFPVGSYLREKLTEAQWNRFFNQVPKTKVQSLIELIEAAKKSQQQVS
jgi:hypothetical protein